MSTSINTREHTRYIRCDNEGNIYQSMIATIEAVCTFEVDSFSTYIRRAANSPAPTGKYDNTPICAFFQDEVIDRQNSFPCPRTRRINFSDLYSIPNYLPFKSVRDRPPGGKAGGGSGILNSGRSLPLPARLTPKHKGWRTIRHENQEKSGSHSHYWLRSG